MDWSAGQSVFLLGFFHTLLRIASNSWEDKLRHSEASSHVHCHSKYFFRIIS
jgi:hypothetical protein